MAEDGQVKSELVSRVNQLPCFIPAPGQLPDTHSKQQINLKTGAIQIHFIFLTDDLSKFLGLHF